MKKYVFLLIIQFCFSYISFAKVDTVFIFSEAMQKSFKTIVVKPDNYKKKKNYYPVVYLLHGAMGNSTNWIMLVPEIQQLANENQLIIVCPDGSPNSWYFDSPVDSSFKFETHISKEVPAYIDAHYKTLPYRNARAITGLSMGGHGGLFIAFRHYDFFGACGSMSGALDISLIKRGYDITKRLGDTLLNKMYYEQYSSMKEMERLPKDTLAIIIDCGIQDFIFGMSKSAHEKLLKLKIKHDYIERPGKHDWKYWGNAIKYQLLFFREYFNKQQL